MIHEVDEENSPEHEQHRQRRGANPTPEQRESQLSKHKGGSGGKMEADLQSNKTEPEGAV